MKQEQFKRLNNSFGFLFSVEERKTAGKSCLAYPLSTDPEKLKKTFNRRYKAGPMLIGIWTGFDVESLPICFPLPAAVALMRINATRLGLSMEWLRKEIEKTYKGQVWVMNEGQHDGIKGTLDCSDFRSLVKEIEASLTNFILRAAGKTGTQTAPLDEWYQLCAVYMKDPELLQVGNVLPQRAVELAKTG